VRNVLEGDRCIYKFGKRGNLDLRLVLLSVVGVVVMVDGELERVMVRAQRGEITEHLIYEKLSRSVKGGNRDVLKRISEDELKHYEFWKSQTSRDVGPSVLRVLFYLFVVKVFGLTFGVKLMEKGEGDAKAKYREMVGRIVGVERLLEEEGEHERLLVGLIDEERLRYVSSMVLGLNDALVELTGALAGFTFALQETRVVAMVGLITGVAAALSMAASEYLSTKSEESGRSPFRAAGYTGVTYIATVFLLILPFLILTDVYICLTVTVINAIAAVFLFTFYISIAKDLPFRRRFLEMVLVSLGVAALSFALGFLVRTLFGVEA